jgi:predicted nucleic acid-binding protein
MRRVFADSFYFFALINRNDPRHAAAVASSGDFQGEIVLTSWFVTELGDGLSRGPARLTFVGLVHDLKSRPGVVIVPASESLLVEGIQLYSQRLDKDWSLTDCISFVVMQHEGITEALTGDHHFDQAGFAALLK